MNYLISDFSILHRQSDIFLTRKLSPLGLGANQFTYILCLCEHPGISQEQLSAFLRIDKGSVAKTVRQLCDQDYFIRKVSETDKRQYELFPTEKATGVYDQLHEIVMEYEHYITRGLTPIEADVLRNLLDKLSDNI
jgi:DNA-binding MarR family transcriptional regulator